MAELSDLGEATDPVGITFDSEGRPIVSLHGEIDLASAPAVRAAIEPIVGEHSKNMTIDLADVQFLDSSGLAVLLAVAERVDDLRLLNPSEIVGRIIEVTGLSQVLRIEP